MSTLLLLLIIGLAVAVGCYVYHKHLLIISKHQPLISRDYFSGLNYLLNEQPDKAVDVFTRLLQVDSETVETHLALGALFRKRGEIGRAIKIHQNLIARPQLSKQQRVTALVALGKDYLHAGFIDRAEKLFLEITSGGDEPLISLHYLLDIYQRQKNWEAAIKVAQQLRSITDEPLDIIIAHYYCELAQQYLNKKDIESCIKSLKQALKSDAQCVRANLLLAKVYFELHRYKDSIAVIEEILKQDKTLFSESLPILISSYIALEQENTCVEFLASEFHDVANITVALYLTDYYRKTKNDEEAIQYLRGYLSKYPSLKGVLYLVNDLPIVKDLIQNILKNMPHYRCGQCGFKSNQLLWLCPGCKSWNEIKPVAY
jgi:lipopolysaccharide biosynthesis regulator YciM